MESGSNPGAQRRKKSAAERRAQRHRSEARLVQRILLAFKECSCHRGGNLSTLGLALQQVLATAGHHFHTQSASVAPPQQRPHHGSPVNPQPFQHLGPFAWNPDAEPYDPQSATFATTGSTHQTASPPDTAGQQPSGATLEAAVPALCVSSPGEHTRQRGAEAKCEVPGRGNRSGSSSAEQRPPEPPPTQATVPPPLRHASTAGTPAQPGSTSGPVQAPESTTGPEPTLVSKPRFYLPGQQVVIQGLQRQRALNGQEGVVLQHFLAGVGESRVAVKMPDGSIVKVKLANLDLAHCPD